jgi:hypothetical protein
MASGAHFLRALLAVDFTSSHRITRRCYGACIALRAASLNPHR